ncbi:MAG: 50S ribosomal protein L29 [Actinomycetota bacterium]|nr:50S ribosomal protein L29 [Actinomycetota bacterium]
MGSIANKQALELREFDEDELMTQLREAKEELFNLRFQVATGQLDNNARLRTVKHTIARIYTVMRERELGLAVAPSQAAADE